MTKPNAPAPGTPFGVPRSDGTRESIIALVKDVHAFPDSTPLWLESEDEIAAGYYHTGLTLGDVRILAGVPLVSSPPSVHAASHGGAGENDD